MNAGQTGWNLIQNESHDLLVPDDTFMPNEDGAQTLSSKPAAPYRN